MSTAALDVYFKLGMPDNIVQKQIRRHFCLSKEMKVTLKMGIPDNITQKQIKLLQNMGYNLQIEFVATLPQSIESKQIKRVFQITDGMMVYFYQQYPYSGLSIWRFVKWTLSDLTNERYYILRSIEKPFVTIDPLPILPKLRGQAYPETKRPEYNIVHKESASGITKTYETWQFPRWYIELTYEFLAGNAEGSDFRRLLDFFIARRGQLEDFWYEDPEDNQVVNEVIAIGDGKEKIFQLCRTYCGSKEPIFAVNADHIFRLTVNDEVQPAVAFSLTNDGRVMFKQPPGNGAVIKASFHFYYRCRFTDDIAEFENFAHKLWSLKTLSFVTTL